MAARDNCTSGEFSPIYIKSILPKGAAVEDGRLERGDRLLEVNGVDMTQKTLHEAVNTLRATKLGSSVEIVVSRQMMPVASSSSVLAARDTGPLALGAVEVLLTNARKATPQKKRKRELLTFEIAFNDTGSAGLGVSVKGKTKRLDNEIEAETSNETAVAAASVDLGIFVKTVINGGAANKDGRLRPNDQLINVNGFSLLGKSNEEAMLILRDAMQYESTHPGYIELTISRKCSVYNEQAQEKDNEQRNNNKTSSLSSTPEKQIVKIIKHTQPPCPPSVPATANTRFNRDAPARRSMSEKRTKLGQVPNTAIVPPPTLTGCRRENSNGLTRRSHTANALTATTTTTTTTTNDRQVTQIPIQIEQAVNLHPANNTAVQDLFTHLGSFESVVVNQNNNNANRAGGVSQSHSQYYHVVSSKVLIF